MLALRGSLVNTFRFWQQHLERPETRLKPRIIRSPRRIFSHGEATAKPRDKQKERRPGSLHRFRAARWVNASSATRLFRPGIFSVATDVLRLVAWTGFR